MMNFSQLNQLAETIDSEGLISENTEAKGPDEIISKVCGIYQKVRPFLEVITSLFFIPKKWRNAVLSFMTVLDGLCPQVVLPDL